MLGVCCQPCPPLDRLKRGRSDHGSNTNSNMVFYTQSDQTRHRPHRFNEAATLKKVKSGMGSPDWHVSMTNLHLRKLSWVYCLGHAGVKGNSPRIDCREQLMQPTQVARVSGDLKREELETLPAGTKPRTSHHRSPGGDRRGKRNR